MIPSGHHGWFRTFQWSSAHDLDDLGVPSGKRLHNELENHRAING